MGLRHFHLFCKVEVPNSFRIVSILEELEKYRSSTGKDPVIIISLKSMISHFQVNNRDVLCGNRMNKIRHQIDYFFSTLQEAGVQLIFPVVKMTPTVSEDDDDHWHRYISKTIIDSMDVLYKISESKSLDQLADIYDAKRVHEFVHPFPFSFSMHAMLLDVAMRYGKIVGFEYSGYNFDPLFDILDLAKKYEAFSVIGFMSYFFVYEGSWKYWSSNSMDIHNMTIVEYKRDNILKFLDLTYEKMPLFTYLSDLKDMDENMYYAIKRKFGGGKFIFKSIGHYVAEQKFPLTFSGLQKIAKDLFGNNYPRHFISDLQKGLRDYFPKTSNNQFEGILADALHSGNSFAFEFLMGSKISLVPEYFDSSFEGLKTVQALIITIMRKCAGILLKNYEDKRSEICVVAKNPKSFEIADRKVEVIWPEFDVPKITDMLKGNTTNGYKIKILIYLTELEIPEDLLMSYPINHLVVLITLTYLISKDSLTKSEARMILQVLHAERIQMIDENIQYPEIINERAFHVSTLLSQFFRYFQYCLNSIGFKKERFDFDFDGVYFQTLLDNNNNNNNEYEAAINDLHENDNKIFGNLAKYCKYLYNN